ncbi:MAG: carboxypeptidase-like regulatory domain-containing protein [Bacteroidota bacterium]
MRRFIYLLCLFFFQSVLSYGQELSFQVVDQEDGSGIPFATLFFTATNVGYSANSSGNFTLALESYAPQDSLVISSLGYLSKTISVESAAETTTVGLMPDFKILKEVVVSARREDKRTLIKNTNRFLKDYLGKEPYYLFSFYKETLKHHNRYIGYTEAYGILHVAGYQPSYNRKNQLFSYDLAQWKNIRRSEYSSILDCDTSRTLAIDKLLKAKSEYLFNGPLNRYDDFTYKIDSGFSSNDSEILIVKFSAKDQGYQGELWIEDSSQKLLSMHVIDAKINERVRSKCQYTSGDFEINFIMLEDEYFVNHVSFTLKDTTHYLTEELTIRGGEYRKNDVMKFNYDQRVILYNEMLNPLVMYEQSFWEDHGVEVDVKIDDDLSLDTPLPDQFFNHNGTRLIPLPTEFNSYEELYKRRDLFQMFMLNSDL